MKYHASFVIFEKALKFEMSSAANYRFVQNSFVLLEHLAMLLTSTIAINC